MIDRINRIQGTLRGLIDELEALKQDLTGVVLPEFKENSMKVKDQLEDIARHFKQGGGSKGK